MTRCRNSRRKQVRRPERFRDESVHRSRPVETNMSAAVTGERRLPPMDPEAAGLSVRRHAIAETGEDEPPVRRDKRIHRQRRDDTVYGVGGFTEGVALSGTQPDSCRTVTTIQTRKIDERNSGDRTLQIGFERRHQSSHIATEGNPEETDPLGTMVDP